ncbi:jasmonate-induced protein homolog [Beta vulgaris subsp. vulgaris]|uniref:jasmonate-induced protein homolog n=1 Tax=Beta vulgaris subsp. vulgaris TaxID=3555 RepID=UPI0020370303|nr:jasmonate-induced protein homolog [Beta vulgaris subsp. vulgaris]
MASYQAPKSSSRINEKHRAAIDELKKELGANESPLSDARNAKAQATTKASMLNNGVGTIKFQEKKDWSGSIVGSIPPTIQLNKSGKFSHRGTPPKDSNGSMGAMVYVGPNVQGGSDNCAWIMAWSTPGDGTENKIYVETGPSTKYPSGSIDWDTIKSSLQNSSNESHYFDEDSQTEVSAQIAKNGNNPLAAAVFDVTLV